MAENTQTPHVDDADLEGGKVQVVDRQYLDGEFVEASLLLAFWSILVMNEGAIRFAAEGRAGAANLFGGVPMRFPNAFLAALFEVIFGLFGLFVGLAGGVLKYFNKTLHYTLLVVQSILGWYVFVVYVFILPAFRIANEEAPQLGLSEAASKAFGVMGILTSLSWCLALQGGQFVFICRSLAYAGYSDFLAQRKGAKMRAIFWSLNYTFAGLWALVGAIIIINGTNGVGVTKGPFFAPPNVGRLPILLLVVAAVMVLWPLVGIALAVTGKVRAIKKYTFASFFVFLVVYANYVLIQFGFMSGNPAPPANVANGAGMHNHLTMMLAFLGPYFLNKYATEVMTS